MALDWLLHPVITHLAVFLLGIPVGVLLNKLIMHGQKRNYNAKLILINIVHAMILGLYVSSLVDAQWFGGNTPNLVFSALAAISFGAVVGEKDTLINIFNIILKK